MTVETQNQQEEEDQEESLISDTTIVTHCIYKNDLERLVKSFELDTNPFHENILELINERDDNGKSPLDLAANFGRTDICRELLKRGADLTMVSENGYSPLHYAAAWGHIEVLKVLVEFQANLQQRNVHKERARETASRYNQTECVDFLDWAEAKLSLLEFIKHCQESITDHEKTTGRVNKEEKTLVTSSCKEKMEWLDTTPDATTQDFITKRQILEETVSAVMLKLSEPLPEKPEKK